ncbi:hypothetical protein J6590_102267 [Homalodisca vitripennis]|nr:hypothetical protein J6590_102267 [Homalodisca vitripennis]
MKVKKKAIRTIANMHFRESCGPAFIQLQLLTLPCLYIFAGSFILLHEYERRGRDNYRTGRHRRETSNLEDRHWRWRWRELATFGNTVLTATWSPFSKSVTTTVGFNCGATSLKKRNREMQISCCLAPNGDVILSLPPSLPLLITCAPGAGLGSQEFVCLVESLLLFQAHRPAMEENIAKITTVILPVK